MEQEGFAFIAKNIQGASQINPVDMNLSDDSEEFANLVQAGLS